jgi:hypothetical protein
VKPLALYPGFAEEWFPSGQKKEPTEQEADLQLERFKD